MTSSLKVVTWNSGGLHSQILRELETWAQDTAQEIVLIQETKWDFDGNWSSPSFHFVHSAGQTREDRVGGVLTMVSTKVAQRSEIQFHPVFPGRLLHVRLNLPQPIDIINAYQYAANDNKLTPERRLDVGKIISDGRTPEPPSTLAHLREVIKTGIAHHKWHDITQLEVLSNCAREMWALFRAMRSHPYTARGIVQAWRQWKEFSKAHREHKARSKARSKQRKQDLLAQARTAAARGDMHKVWQAVKTLAPKTRPKPLQLYRSGHIMTPESELAWIAEAFGERYGDREPPTQAHIRRHAPFQVSAEDVRSELEHLPVRKAVPPEAAPSALWKACAAEVAEFIAEQVNEQWAQSELKVPQSWADATVALIPKPTGKNESPLDWRPIGLQHPIGKSIMRIVIDQARHQIYQLVHEWPQCAYVPNRSTFTALKRVYQHCDEIRSKCAQQRTTLHQKKEGVERTTNYGGLQISMDLSAAFDLVPWTAIKEAMELACIEPFVQELLLQWLGQVRYKFRHKGMEKEVWPSWGLRQGCIGSRYFGQLLLPYSVVP
ncbi:unnamed protein product [Symbiodinium sp. CCMP2456]|nr:unnamed protein product [Symbiodinium sp. CCMP2456]